MTFIGIDPGKSGAIAIIREDGSVDTAIFSEDEYRDRLFSLFDRNNWTTSMFAIVEDVHAMPKQGVSSMFNFGFNKGWICGLLYAIGIPTQLIPPHKWKKEFGLLNSDKGKSIECARKLFPNANLMATERCRKPHDGMAEALLMAEYGRRLHNRTPKQYGINRVFIPTVM